MKVDCQAGVGLSGSTIGGGPTAAASYHAALEDSVAANFPGNACINCMCHSTENLYRCGPRQGSWRPHQTLLGTHVAGDARPAQQRQQCPPCSLLRSGGTSHRC